MENKEATVSDTTEVIIQSIGGKFGRFQVICLILYALPLALSGSFGLNYVFTALDLDYRCYIPECDIAEVTAFKPQWLSNAVPFENDRPAKCLRYGYLSTDSNHDSHCSADQFNHSKIDDCNQFVYKTNDVSILNEFGLHCKSNEWKLAMVGTVNNIGRFIFTPVMGHISDRFGRRTVLIIGVLGSSIFATIRSMSSSYSMYLIFEFLDSAIGSATYAAALILGLEWVATKDRVLFGMIITATYPLGQVFLGVTAQYVNNFRTLTRIIYTPGFLMIAYYWIAPESIRWLLSKRKLGEVKQVVRRAARINNIELSDHEISIMINSPSNDTNKLEYQSVKKEPISTIFKSKYFITRFLICSFCWTANAFVSYGISLTSVSLAGDKYINFIVVALAGTPAVVVCYFMLEHLGRRKTLCSSLIIGGVAIILSKFLNNTVADVFPLILYFLGKCFIVVSFSGLYVYTSELWPTSLRHSMMSLCSSAGRIGSMSAPLAPLLANYFEMFPYLMFGMMALISGILVLQLPETVNRKLPDTLDEARI